MKKIIFLATVACLLSVSLWMTACQKEQVTAAAELQPVTNTEAGDRDVTCNCTLSITGNQEGNYSGKPWNLQMMYHNGTGWVTTAPPLINRTVHNFTIKKGTSQYFTFDALAPVSNVAITTTLRCSGNNTPGSGCVKTYNGPANQYTEILSQSVVSSSCTAACTSAE